MTKRRPSPTEEQSTSMVNTAIPAATGLITDTIKKVTRDTLGTAAPAATGLPIDATTQVTRDIVGTTTAGLVTGMTTRRRNCATEVVSYQALVATGLREERMARQGATGILVPTDAGMDATGAMVGTGDTKGRSTELTVGTAAVTAATAATGTR